jgi:hypothetical protein
MINESTQAELQDKASALDRMKKTGITIYKAHGIELIHVSTDKLRVKLIDDDSGGGDEALAGEQGALPDGDQFSEEDVDDDADAGDTE